MIATIYMQRIVDRERQQSTDSLDKIPLLKIISVVVFVVVCVNVRERQQSTETLGKIPLLKIISLVFVVVNVVVYVNVRERKQQSTKSLGKIPLLKIISFAPAEENIRCFRRRQRQRCRCCCKKIKETTINRNFGKNTTTQKDIRHFRCRRRRIRRRQERKQQSTKNWG